MAKGDRCGSNHVEKHHGSNHQLGDSSLDEMCAVESIGNRAHNSDFSRRWLLLYRSVRIARMHAALHGVDARRTAAPRYTRGGARCRHHGLRHGRTYAIGRARPRPQRAARGAALEARTSVGARVITKCGCAATAALGFRWTVRARSSKTRSERGGALRGADRRLAPARADPRVSIATSRARSPRQGRGPRARVGVSNSPEAARRSAGRAPIAASKWRSALTTTWRSVAASSVLRRARDRSLRAFATRGPERARSWRAIQSSRKIAASLGAGDRSISGIPAGGELENRADRRCAPSRDRRKHRARSQLELADAQLAALDARFSTFGAAPSAVGVAGCPRQRRGVLVMGVPIGKSRAARPRGARL